MSQLILFEGLYPCIFIVQNICIWKGSMFVNLPLTANNVTFVFFFSSNWKNKTWIERYYKGRTTYNSYVSTCWFHLDMMTRFKVLAVIKVSCMWFILNQSDYLFSTFSCPVLKHAKIINETVKYVLCINVIGDKLTRTL